MNDDNTGSVPEDRLLDSPLVGNPAKADITSGKVANTPDTEAGATDGDLGKLPDVTKIEQDITRNFFKGPKKSIDATAASLLNTKGTSVLQAYKQFVTGNGGKLSSGNATSAPSARATAIGTTPQFKTRSDYVADAMHIAASRATIDMHRFHHAYSLPYMKRSLALAYDRTQMMRASVKLLDKTRAQLLAKLDAIKLNTAAPEAAKTSFREKVWDETRRQSISRLAASIQDLGFQYANRAYVSSINAPLVKLRDKLSRGEKLSGVVRSSTLRGVERLNRMRDRSAAPETGLHRYIQSFRNSVLKAGVGVGTKIPANSKLLDVAGDVAYPLLDVASKFNPFNKSVFNPMASTTSSGAENFVSIDGSVQPVSSASSPLLKAFTSWVREYRVDQHELQAILLGKKTKISDIRKGDPEKDALSAYLNDVNKSNSSKSGGGIFSSLRSAIRDTRARYKSRHTDKTDKSSVTEKVKTHFQTSTLAADVSGISAFFKSKTHVSADEIIDTLKDVKDPSQLRRIISELGPKATAILKSPEAKRLAVVAAAGNAALLTYLGLRNRVDPNAVWNKLPESLRTKVKSVKRDKKTPDADGTDSGGILSSLRSTIKDTRARYTTRHVDKTDKSSVTKKVKTHFRKSTLATDVSGISAFFKSKTHVSAAEVIARLKDVKDPSQLRKIIADLGPKAKAVLKSPEARRLAGVAAAGNAALLTYLGVRNSVDTSALWNRVKNTIPTRYRSATTAVRDYATENYSDLIDRVMSGSNGTLKTNKDGTPISIKDFVQKYNKPLSIAAAAAGIPFSASTLYSIYTKRVEHMGSLKEMWRSSASKKRIAKFKDFVSDGYDNRNWRSYTPWDLVTGKASIKGYFQDQAPNPEYIGDTDKLTAWSRLRGVAHNAKAFATNRDKRLDAILMAESAVLRGMLHPRAIADMGKTLVRGKIAAPAFLSAYALAHVAPRMGARLTKAATKFTMGTSGLDIDGNKKHSVIRDTVTQELINTFFPGGKASKKLIYLLTLPSYRNLINGDALRKLRAGKPITEVLNKTQFSALVSKINHVRQGVEDVVHTDSSTLAESAYRTIGKTFGNTTAEFARTAGPQVAAHLGKTFGSVSDNLKSLTDAMGVQDTDSVFRKYVAGIDKVNSRIRTGAGLFSSVLGLFGHGDKDKKKGYAANLLGHFGTGALLKYGPKLYYKLSGEQARIEAEALQHGGLYNTFNTVRKLVYNPNELTKREFNEQKKRKRKIDDQKRKDAADAKAERLRKRKASDDAYYEKQRQKRIKNDALSRQKQRGGNPTAMDLLISKLTGKKTDRLNSYEDQIRKDAIRKKSAYTWRRAMGLGSRNDTHRYRDGYGLIGSGMDMYSNFASSALGSVAGKALGLGWGATKLAGRGVGAAAHYGWRAFKGRGIAGAVRAGRGALPALGRGAMSLGKFAMGPIGASMGVGLVAHELDVGINQNLTGKTRRIADTAAKAVEYGSMGFLFGGPVGAAIGAGVGALIANSDYAASALKGIGHVVMAGVRPLWHGIEAVGRGLWNVTKFTGRVAGGLWTTVFGQSAKVDRNGHVIRQHKASLMEDFRIAFFGRKEVRTRTGEIAVTGRNSIFGDVKYGFQKLLFGDKFSNGKYKPGTSLIDELGSGIKHAFLGTVHAVKNLPHTIANMFKSIWNRGTKSGKSVGHAAKEAFTDGIHGVASVGKSIGHFVKRPFSAAYDALQRKKKKIADDLKYAKEHPFKAAARVLMDTSIFSVIGTGTVRAAAGGFRAASAWLLESKAARDPSSPLYQYISTCLKAYGVSDRSMYDYLHTLETYQADIKSHKTAQYSSSDMAWICGKFGLDSSNPDCVNYFTTWYNHRFVPVTEILTNVLKTYKYDINNVFSAPTDVAKKINSDLDKAFQSLLDPSVSALVPTKEGYLKFSKKGSEKPSTMSPSSTQSQKPYDPRNPQSVVDTAKRAAKNPNAGYSGVNTDNFKAASGRSTPQMSQGKVTDQPEYKAAFSKLSGPLKNEVSKNKSLQFVLWSTSVQHGPIAAAKMFQTEYHPGTTTKNFIKDIYQSRSLKFVGNDSQDAVAAAQQLGQEQSFALQMDSGATDPSLQDMGKAIGHPIMGLGDGGTPIQTAPLTGSVKSRAADAVNYLMSKYKLPAFKADALVGNFIQESKLDYTNQSGDGGHAHGIAQWHGDRRAAIQKQFGKPVEAMDLHGQLDAVMWEMSSNGPERAGGAAFQRATNVNQAIDALVNGYERPADRAGNIRVRTALAEQVGKDLGNLNNQNTPQQGGANVVAAPDIGPAASGNRNVQTASNVTLDKNAQASLQAHADALNNHAKAMAAATPVLASTNIPSASAPASTTHVVNSAPVIVASNQTNKQSQQDISLSKHSVTTGLASM